MTHAGAWLLTGDIQRYSRRAHVSCALFQGQTKTQILDRKDFSADLHTICQEVLMYVASKLNTALVIKDDARHQERPELPLDALREAIVNAVVHRDYRSTANTQVHIYRDRVEIINPGGLPAGMTAADLGSKSVPRNPLLFGLFYRMDLVEQIGSGIRRIRTLCREYGVPEPLVQPQADWVTVVFAREVAEKTGQVIGQVTGQVTGQVGEILQALETRPLPAQQTMDKIGLSHRQTFRENYINPALEAGLIERTIPDKPRSRLQRYRLTEKGRKSLAAMI